MKELEKLKEKNEYLLKRCGEMQERVEAYEEIIGMYTGYISLLLQKMGADRDHPVEIGKDDVKAAMENLEARAEIGEGGAWRMYYTGK